MRSLTASPAGIERAKRALVRKQLTQKAIAQELGIASWATVNKFFNGKGIDRFIFQSICDALDLDWQDVVLLPSEPDPPVPRPPDPGDAAPLLQAVQTQSQAAREALTPRILERIPRSVVTEKYLPAIARGLAGPQPRVVPIIAPAGYGKSTILGDMYDRLQADTPWVGLILCSNLSLSTGFVGFRSHSIVAATFAMVPQVSTTTQASYLESGLGSSLTGMTQSIVTIVQDLNRAYGRGVLLIDTLDLVINREFVPAFSGVLRQLLDAGTTIVFTCRDYEYSDYLEPTRERLAGLSQQVDRQSVPNFTTTEIRLAAERFFQKLEPNTPERGQAFADNILHLSADNRSLQEIIQNPLLLALLCDLFAQDGNVPPDLTVSKLYQRYWYEKVAYCRVERSHSAPLAIAKESLCLSLSQAFFELSRQKLCESAYADELGITTIDAAAYDALLSEGVLERLPSHRIHFFHQTLLEYAIAYWLTRRSAEPQRDWLLETLQQTEISRSQTYWLPILRQYLTLVEPEAEFEQLVQRLNSQDVGIFGAIAYAAVSRQKSAALLGLLPTALQLGEAHQKRLRQALEAAPRQVIEAAWEVLQLLLEQAEHATAANTAKLVGGLMERWWGSLSSRLPDILAAVARRKAEDRSLLLGWLLQPCLPLLEAQPKAQLLAALREHFLLLGHRTKSAVLHLHQLPAVEAVAQADLLARLVAVGTPAQEQVETDLITFVAAILPDQLARGTCALGNSWAEVLYREHPKGWAVVHGRAVGRCAAQDMTVLQPILTMVLAGDTDHLRRNLIALEAAIAAGASSIVAQQITVTPVMALEAVTQTAIVRFLRHVGQILDQDDQETFAVWLQPLAAEQSDRLMPVWDVLADGSLTARRSLQQGIATVAASEQARYQARLMCFESIVVHPPLKDWDKVAQMILVRHYQTLAQTDPLARDRLLAAMGSPLKDIAVAASQGLEVWGLGLDWRECLGLLASRFPGVRFAGLNAILHQYRQGLELAGADLTTICGALAREANQVVARTLCELVADWVQQRRQVPAGVAVAIGGLMTRLVQNGTFEGGMLRVMLAALKAIAQTEDAGLDVEQMRNWVRQLLLAINLIQGQNAESEMIDLLSAMNRLDAGLLAEVVRQDCPLLAARGWVRNVSAVIKTIRRVETKSSPLLDEILAADWCGSGIAAIVIEVRGG